APNYRGVPGNQPLHGIEVSGNAGAEHLPYIDAGARGPPQRLVLLQFAGLNHTCDLTPPTAYTRSPRLSICHATSVALSDSSSAAKLWKPACLATSSRACGRET